VRREQQCRDGDVERALLALDGAPVHVCAAHWPGPLEGLDLPGLYAWWTDNPGAELLSAGLARNVAAGRIYAGQTGATK
jgi:hypothetical protein